jgi:bifunctional polynucleotide phosphatase/kinase
VLFVGYPAMGKTTLYKRHFEPAGYGHINQDTLKTKAKCLNAVEAALKDGRSVVVGAFSPDPHPHPAPRSGVGTD